MSSDYTSHGLRKWRLDNLPEPLANLLKQEQYVKPWRMCRTCGVAANHYCKRCGNVGCADKTRYCSRACQAKDWKRHANDCQGVITLDWQIGNTPAFEGVDFRRRQIRQIARWTAALEIPRKWVIKQAYMLLPEKERRDVCLHISMVSTKMEAQSTLRVDFFEFKREDWSREPSRPRGVELSLAFFRIYINGAHHLKGWEILDDPSVDISRANEHFPQWPWIFSHCAAMGDINTHISTMRLILLLDSIAEFGDPNGNLALFRAHNNSTRRWDMTERSFDRWMKLMYPVTAEIGSRFHCPCDYPAGRYGHLK